ncbi:MAG: DNA-processing protein DprA [Prevotellaceae bacterium]|nr:DNA-processing protein DprA [Prevotellaceae bacterium]
MITKETIDAIALSLMFPNRLALVKQLYEKTGSATVVFDNADCLGDLVADLNAKSFSIEKEQIAHFRGLAEEEAEYAEKHKIECIEIGSPSYPIRLREVCDTAPIVLFFKGNANLNSHHIISIVGTRDATAYGRDMTEVLVGELARKVPDVLIVSGLAYGTDINAHRASLTNGLATVGVLAHGLNTIYPSAHRNVAAKMLQSGGLLTEFITKTRIEPYNFLRRNRIIAGLAEATIVVESKEKGGAMATARFANEFSLEVLAFPGRANDEKSKGCNRLIADNRAAMITSADDLIKAVGWDLPDLETTALPSLFDCVLSDEESRVYACLAEEPKHLSVLIEETGLEVSMLMSVLGELDFKGLARSLPGAKWRKTTVV